MNRCPTEEIYVENVLKVTDEALLVYTDGREVWLPKSVVPDHENVTTDFDGYLDVAEWCLIEKELV